MKASHNAGIILNNLFLMYFLNDGFLSYEDAIKNPLITKKQKTPGKGNLNPIDGNNLQSKCENVWTIATSIAATSLIKSKLFSLDII